MLKIYKLIWGECIASVPKSFRKLLKPVVQGFQDSHMDEIVEVVRNEYDHCHTVSTVSPGWKLGYLIFPILNIG